MNENAGKFRSAAFGGFHRQDVLDYLAHSTKENQEQLNSLRQELETAKSAQATAEGKLSDLNWQAENAQAAQEELEQALGEAKAELEEKTTALAEMETQLDTLRSRVEELEPGAVSWQRIRLAAGDIEISAHERAQMILQDARARAAEIRAEGIRCVLELQRRCDAFQEALQTSLYAAKGEMDTVNRSFEEIQTDVEGCQKDLSALLELEDTPQMGKTGG